MTRTRPSLPVIGVLLLFLSPLALITPWVFVLVSPVVVGAALVFGLPTLGLRPVIKPEAPPKDHKVDLLCLEGLDEHPEVADALRAELEALWAAVPEHEDPAACACVKASEGGWVGVLRMRSTKGHSYAEVEGADPGEAGARLVEQVRTYKSAFPILQPEPEGHPKCTSAGCHLGRASLFYIDRDKYGRPRSRSAA